MASTQTKAADPNAAGSLGELPTAKDLMQQVALKEAEKASAAMRERTAGETE